MNARAQALARGDLDDAANSLVAAASQTHVAEHDYVSVLRPLADVLRSATTRGARSRCSGTWRRARPTAGSARTRCSHDVPPVDRARTLAATGDMAGAAREMENAGLVAAAAIYREKADDWRGARALWSRLAQVDERRRRRVQRARSSSSTSRAARRSAATRARRARRSSPRCASLEEAADHFESRRPARARVRLLPGARPDRARERRCSRTCSRASSTASASCARTTSSTSRSSTSRTRSSRRRSDGELSAAATLAREAADYARALGMASASAPLRRSCRPSSGATVAQQHLERGAPAGDRARTRCSRRSSRSARSGQYARVGELYSELAHDGSRGRARTKHYARAAKRYDGVRDEPLDTAPLPSHLRQDNHFPDVWHVDLIEWEQQGSAAEACADVLLDKRWPDLIRRKAMLARLTAFAVEGRPDDTSARGDAPRACGSPSSSRSSSSTPCSRRSRSSSRGRSAPVKVAVLAAMQTLFFKRSFVTVRAALRDARPAVVEQAAQRGRVALLPARVRSALAHRPRVAAARRRAPRRCARSRASTRWRRRSSCSACSSTARRPTAWPRSRASSARAARASSSSRAAAMHTADARGPGRTQGHSADARHRGLSRQDGRASTPRGAGFVDGGCSGPSTLDFGSGPLAPIAGGEDGFLVRFESK